MNFLRWIGLAAMLVQGAAVSQAQALFERGARVLFQGDSITDMNRGRTDDPNHILGHSYVFLIAAKQGATYPERKVTFINRGVSGNTLKDLATRWEKDTLTHQPDVLSVLIGVNDVANLVRTQQPFPTEEYEAAYDKLLAATVAAFPKIKLVLCAPFFTSGSRTNAGSDEWAKDVKEIRGVLDRLAAKYKAPVVDFQKVFDDAFKRAPIETWIWDGIHPTYAGHQLMADEWQRAYKAFYGSLAEGR